jgi:hypothetical protein
MTRDDIIRMAQQTGWDFGYEMCVEHVCEFAALVAAAEREACAKVCDGIRYNGYWPPEDGAAPDYYNSAAAECAATIRARGV